MSDPQLQRSHVSRHAIKLAVTNRSGKDVKLIWRDYAGQRQEHAELKEAHRLVVTTYGSHPWEVETLEGQKSVGFAWPPERWSYFEAYRYLQHQRQERRISREEVESIVAGGKTLEVEVVERYLQPQKLRPLLLRWIADRPLTKDQVEGLGLPGTLADELITLLVG